MSPADTDLGEFELIRRFFLRGTARAAAESGVILGIGDDAALLEVPDGTELAAGRGHHRGGPPFSPGRRRALGGASGAGRQSERPGGHGGDLLPWATLALTLPAADAPWLEGFSAGLLDLADAHGVALVGGDTTRGPLTVSIQLLGHVARGTALRRGGRPGRRSAGGHRHARRCRSGPEVCNGAGSWRDHGRRHGLRSRRGREGRRRGASWRAGPSPRGRRFRRRRRAHTALRIPHCPGAVRHGGARHRVGGNGLVRRLGRGFAEAGAGERGWRRMWM